MGRGGLDPETERAARAFLDRAAARYDVAEAVLFGSRARGDYRADSDADIAVVLRGIPGPRMDAALDMADMAFDVLLDTGILVEAIPFWEDEWRHPENFANPALIENIRRDGMAL
jgi:predicted nucleotidyltransferase